MARRRHNAFAGFSDINITPLMDLTFLLLIVFMITAPMMQFSLDVSPPQLNSSPLDDRHSILVSLHADGAVVINDRRIDPVALERILQNEFQTRPDATVLIRGHEERPYREVIALMKAAYRTGFEKVSLVTVAEDDK